VLKRTSKSMGIKECTCGAQDHANLAAHEGAANHNLH